MEIKIDPVLQGLLPALTDEQFEQLEMNILANPERVTLVMWTEQGVLLDGHNRYAICQKHKLRYRVDQVSLRDLDAAKLWVVNEHLGRRNFSDEQASYWRGKQEEFQKKSVGRPGNKLVQNGLINANGQGRVPSTRQAVAQQHRVSESTIHRDVQFAHAVDTIAAAVGDGAKDAILAREMSAPKKFVFNDPGITETPQMDFPQAFEFIKQNALDKNEHHPKCSYRQAGMLCDCSILWAEYYKRRVAALEAQVQQLRERIKSRIDYRLNERLCTMKPEWDDSMTGFNDAWDIVREVFKDEEDAALAATEPKETGKEI